MPQQPARRSPVVSRLVLQRASLALTLAASLAGCARGAVIADDREIPGSTPGTEFDSDTNLISEDTDAGNGETEQPAPEVDAGMPVGPGPMEEPEPEPGTCEPTGGTCEGLAAAAANLDASDSASVYSTQGMGEAWIAIDLHDGNLGAMSTTRIGVDVRLDAPAGSNYQVTLVGDTGPGQAGRCVPADVTDTTPLQKTAIWGSFGPTEATARSLAIHVEDLGGGCEPWTLTVGGNPCPQFTIGFGEDSMGSCP